MPIRPWALVVVVALGTAAAARAAPIIDISPGRLEFSTVTLGDTVATPLGIANRGDTALTVTAIDLPEGVSLSAKLPIELEPDSSIVMTVTYAALDTLPGDKWMDVHSTDPVNTVWRVAWDPDVRPLGVETLALTTPGPYPLGEAIVIQSVPFERVHAEQVTLHYRSGRFANFVPEPMVSNGRAFIAIIPGDFVQEGGVDFYVVAENSGFTMSDPADGDRRPYQVDVASPREYKLTPVVQNPGFTWRVGENIDFLLTLSRGTVYQSGLLHYRRAGDSLYQEIDVLEMSFTGIAASIPGDWVGPRGVEYWSEIQTLTQRITDPAENPESQPHELRIAVDDLEEPKAHTAARYRMLSVPLVIPPSTGLAAILSDEDEFGSYDVVRWRAFRYLPELQANVELGPDQASRFALEPGRAFWVISRAAHRIDTAPVPGISTPTASPFSLVLAPGWNQIGDPYAFPVAWASVRRPIGVGDPVAYDSERGDYADSSPAVLEPFAGYFVENVSTQAETLVFSPIAADSALAAAAAPILRDGSAPAWSVRLEAHVAGGADLANRLGVAADASDARDARDQSKPPFAPGARVRLAIVNGEVGGGPALYRRDFRSMGGEGQTWEIEITAAEPGDPVELLLRPEGSLPPGTSLRLVDREQGAAIDLDPRAPEWRHTVLAFGPSRPYRIALLAGSADYVSRAGASEAPAALRLDRVTPNPARGAQQIRFGLPRAAAVRLEVFDASGRRVATLLDGRTLAAGFHTVVWRPDRESARPASGVYFHRLTAGGETRNVRSVLLR